LTFCIAETGTSTVILSGSHPTSSIIAPTNAKVIIRLIFIFLSFCCPLYSFTAKKEDAIPAAVQIIPSKPKQLTEYKVVSYSIPIIANLPRFVDGNLQLPISKSHPFFL
jgi:hypothetical protein